ncbi:MAG: diguanylate cyclase [Thermodesulfobacteriota bacterium]
MTQTCQGGIAVLCDENGAVVEIIRDEVGLLDQAGERPLVLRLIYRDDHRKFLNFLLRVRIYGSAFDWEIAVRCQEQAVPFYFAGVIHDTRLLVVASNSQDGVYSLYEELMLINNEQVNQLRQVLKEKAELLHQTSEGQDGLWSELTRMNNELINLQRELAKKNAALEAANSRITELLHTDPLTGVANRRHVQEVFQKAVARCNRHEISLVVVMCDLDHFKTVNDTYGHAVGDRVLQDFANVLLENCRQEDLIGRFGGEEFLLVLQDTDLAEGQQLAERMRQRVAHMPLVAEDVRQTASFGVAEYRPGEDPEATIQRADKAMYAAKIGGRDMVVAENGVATAEVE